MIWPKPFMVLPPPRQTLRSSPFWPSISCYQSILMLFIVWQNRHHEALLPQSNNCKLTEKAVLSRSKQCSDTICHYKCILCACGDRCKDVFNRRRDSGLCPRPGNKKTGELFPPAPDEPQMHSMQKRTERAGLESISAIW